MSERLIDSYLKGVELRRTVRNWPEDVKAVADGYRTHTIISHAVQKDAIQNGWSAKKNRKGREWNFTFELIEARDRKFLLMTDEGTTGLTGKVLTPEEYEIDLPGEERWGRFEGVAFTQPRAERTLGSRGRGKFIFVAASNEFTILYDTLRDDGTYRFGFRTVIRTESPVAAYDGEDGKQKLREMTSNLIQPLSSVGTRVIIVSPLDELVYDIKSGRFVRYIGETWWEIIQKHDATIRVKAGGREKIASIPKEFDLKDEDSGKFKVWLKGNQRIPVSFGETRIKNLHIVYNSDKAVPEDIRGVAIQRDGMKICKIEPRYMGREIAERLYGYINFDRDTEEALLEDEGIEHYSYDFRRAQPGAVKRFVEDEIMRFAQEKLGYGIDARELRRQHQRNAERRALVAINRFAREIGIGIGPGRRGGGGGGGPRTPKEIYIEFDDMNFPRQDDLRVNYGESISNIRARIVNDSVTEVIVRFKLFVRFYDRLIKTYAEQDFIIPPQHSSDHIGPYQETFQQADFPSTGRHTIVAMIISLRDEDKTTKLDVENRSFYLEEDPPEHGLFEKCEPMEFPERAKMIMAESLTGERGGLVLQYNINHPANEAVQGQEDDLAAYLVWLMGHEMCRYDLLQENPVLFDTEDKDNPDAVLRKTLRKIGEFVHRFRMGEFD
ncbi:hypothetical protein CVT91_09055 [Candidatus Atribacteria bacterium HGW-Atribacteria-1]|nr:MAG: hypothetical protein CVT91_09055 [Candidatus Atribacteria bacterium HGW-Atribacteria-1]